MANIKKQSDVFQMGNELLLSYYELNEEQKFLMIPYELHILPEFWDLSEEDKFTFLKLLNHSLEESRLKYDGAKYDLNIASSKTFTSNVIFLSVFEYKCHVFNNTFRKLVKSSKPWMFEEFVATIVISNFLTDDKNKITAINYLKAIISYIKDVNSKELNRNLWGLEK